MSYATLISPTDVRDYAKAHEWIPVPEAVPDHLYVLNNPAIKYRQIIVPMDANRPDYDDALRIAIEKFAEREARPFHAVEASLKEAGADTLRFGVSMMRTLEDGLPLSYAARAIGGAERTLRAAACSQVQRQPFHPKMKRTELVKEAKKEGHSALSANLCEGLMGFQDDELRANLSPAHHKLAHQAYPSPKPYVKIIGLLNPGNQLRRLTQVKDFEILKR